MEKRREKKKLLIILQEKIRNPIFFAGIYEEDQFCLITEEAKDNNTEIHHRQPVIINQTDVNRYLNLELQGSAFLKECSKPDLVFHEVSKDVINLPITVLHWFKLFRKLDTCYKFKYS
jgi:putative SOS response-associated peptidase YedK